MAKTNLVIVESPSKASTIKGYLGSNYKVIASVGHVRDLPKSTLGVDIDNNFAAHYINIRGKGDIIKEIKKEAKNANKVFLTTDPDREGEAISWHLATALGIPVEQVQRVTFNEITKSVVKASIKQPRPIDMHLAAFSKLGAEISENGGEITCRLPKGRGHGSKISLSFPSVGATENIILCSVLAEGETVVNNAAREPEICDMCRFLRACGAKIKGDGESRIVIEGVEKLHGCEYCIMPDRIAGATYLAMTAAAGGAMILKNACIAEMEPFISVLEQTGCYICTADNRIYLRRGGRLKAIRDRIRTMPHPGFPTDAQAVLMAALAAADGTSVFEENIFDCRYRHTDALIKMGADIQVMGKAAVIRGVKGLHGADVEATDLRGGAAMAVAALGAEGTTSIGCINHIDRGYEKFEDNITSLGGRISRV